VVVAHFIAIGRAVEAWMLQVFEKWGSGAPIFCFGWWFCPSNNPSNGKFLMENLSRWELIFSGRVHELSLLAIDNIILL